MGALACVVAEVAIGVDVAAGKAGSSRGSIVFSDAGVAGGAGGRGFGEVPIDAGGAVHAISSYLGTIDAIRNHA